MRYYEIEGRVVNSRQLGEELGLVPLAAERVVAVARAHNLPLTMQTLRTIKGRRGKVTYIVDGVEYNTATLSKLLHTVQANVHNRVFAHLRAFPGEPLSMARLKLRGETEMRLVA